MTYEALLINKAKVVSKTTDKWKEPTATTVREPIPCRVMFRNRRVVDFKGEERLSIAKIFFEPDAAFNFADELQLDVEGYAINHAILDINKPQDKVKRHHMEVYIS